MKPIISIIIPIYNMDTYLNRCIESILNQSFKDFEVIAINDGSKDRSVEILREYRKRDKRIVIINKKNNGVSAARNDGIKVAKGDYIGFVDPDDWIEPDMYKVMYEEAIEKNIDIVMCSYMREFKDHSKPKSFKMSDRTVYYGQEVQKTILRRLVGPLEKEVSNPELLDAWGTVWSKLYSSKLIKNNSINFVDLKEIGSNEDTVFNIQACYYANSFMFLNRPLYHYWRVNNSSITTRYNPHLVEQFGKLHSIIENFLVEKRLEKEYFQSLENRVCMNILGLGLNAISKNNNKSFIKRISEIRDLLNNNRFTYSLNQFQIEHCSLIWKIFFILVKKRKAFLVYIMLTSIEILRKTIR